MATSWLIVGGRVVDGTRAPAVEDGAVLIRDQRIEAVGPAAEVKARSNGDEQVIDLAGGTVMPGLIDCHQHLDKFGTPIVGTVQQALTYSLEYNCIAAVPNAKTVLEAGYTTVRDTGCRGNLSIALRDAIVDGYVPGPRIVASGSIISTSAGLADFYPSWVDNKVGLGIIVNGEAEILAAVRNHIKDGVDNIKLEASGGRLGFLPPRLPTMNVEEIAVACREAHKRGKTAAAHAEHLDAVKNALRGGVDTIEHGEYLDDEAVELFLERDAFLVATTSNLRRLEMTIEKAAESGQAPANLDEVKRRFEGWVEGFQRAHGRGVRIAAGSDIANTNPHGRNAVELENLCRYGMSPAEAINAATQVAAQALNRVDEVGTLEQGKLADVLLVQGNPLEDVRILQDASRLSLIMKGGQVVIDRAGMTAGAN